MKSLKHLKHEELQGMFGEVDELISALVCAIRGLRESALSGQHCELRPHVEQLDREAQEWVERLHKADQHLAVPAQLAIQVDTVLEVHVVVLCYTMAPEWVRERFGVPETRWNEYARELIRCAAGLEARLVMEAALLAPAGRFELYFSSPETKRSAAVKCALDFLAAKTGLLHEALLPHICVKSGDGATRHLFEVAAGLDSPVLGEAQILAHVKACYERSIAKPSATDPTGGSGGKAISKMLNAAVRTGKLVRTQTDINRGAISMSTAAVEVAVAQARDVLGKPVDSLRICFVGAETISRLVLTQLVGKHPGLDVVLVDESLLSAQQLLSALADAVRDDTAVDRIRLEPWDRLWDVVAQSDVAFVAVPGDKLLISAEKLAHHVAGPLLLFDIAELPAVARDCYQVPGVHTVSANDLREVVRTNAAKRQAEAELAREVVREQVSSFKVWLCSAGAVPYLTALQAKAEEIRQRETRQLARALKGLEVQEREAIDVMTKAIIARLLQPVYESVKTREDADEKRQRILALKELFALEPLHDRELLPPAPPAATPPGLSAAGPGDLASLEGGSAAETALDASAA